MTTRPISILGAGLAGLSAAVTLAAYGSRVTVHERNSDCGTRFHGDYQGMENWSVGLDAFEELGPLSLGAGFFQKPVSEGTLLGQSRHAKIRSHTPLFYLVKRGLDPDSMDQALKRRALELGVDIRFNSDATAAGCDIIATGPVRPNIFAVGLLFATSNNDTMIGLLDDTTAPQGYAYLLIAKGRGTLVVTHFTPLRDSSRYLKQAEARFRELIDLDMREIRPFGGAGVFHLPATAVRDGKLYVGEAAGFQDFLFGFGTRYAMVSGLLAARSILEGKDYDRLWKERFGRLLRVSALNRRLYERFGKWGYDLFLKRLEQSGDPRQVMHRCYQRSLLWLPFA